MYNSQANLLLCLYVHLLMEAGQVVGILRHAKK